MSMMNIEDRGKMRSISARKQLGFGEHGGTHSSLASEMSLFCQLLLIVLHLLLLPGVLEPQSGLFLFPFPLLYQFVQPSLNLFLQVAQFYFLLSFQQVQSCLHLNVSVRQPFLLLFSHHRCYFLLQIMGLNKTQSSQSYFFCLAMCSSIFLRFKHSEDSFTLRGNNISSSVVLASNSVRCLSSISLVRWSPSLLWFSIVFSQCMVSSLSYFSQFLISSSSQCSWRLFIQQNLLSSYCFFNFSERTLHSSASIYSPLCWCSAIFQLIILSWAQISLEFLLFQRVLMLS